VIRKITFFILVSPGLAIGAAVLASLLHGRRH
jgi:hypothetical protein